MDGLCTRTRTMRLRTRTTGGALLALVHLPHRRARTATAPARCSQTPTARRAPIPMVRPRAAMMRRTKLRAVPSASASAAVSRGYSILQGSIVGLSHSLRAQRRLRTDRTGQWVTRTPLLHNRWDHSSPWSLRISTGSSTGSTSRAHCSWCQSLPLLSISSVGKHSNQRTNKPFHPVHR